jgi:short subunit fatty acids transporter
MAELKDYLYEPIKRGKINFISSFISNLELIYHSLLPHSFPVEPKSKITSESIEEKDIDVIYESSLEIYKDSKERIKSLESKAFNLMTYISAITAVLVFLLDKEINSTTKTLAIISIIVLILALLISLRCIGIKIQKTLFINSLFVFKKKKTKTTDKKHISAELINNALFNQNVADNTTDILKASRILLVYGIILSSISFLSYIISDNEIKKSNKIEVMNSKYIDSIYTDYKTIKETELIQIKNKIDSLKIEMDNIKEKETEPKK